MASAQPFTTLGLKKNGICGLCGSEGRLTDTHVPPRCAGNDGKAQPLVLWFESEGGAALGPGRVRTGGSRAYLLCEPCNNRLGSWDVFLGDFWSSLMTQLAAAQGQTSTAQLVIELQKGKPGAIVRSILGGMFAINPGLRACWPHVAAAVVSGEPLEPPSEMRLLLEIYLGERGWVSGGGAKVNPSTRVGSYIDGEWVWPPLHLLLTRTQYSNQWPGAMDISGWLLDSGTTERTVALLLPAVGDAALWAGF